MPGQNVVLVGDKAASQALGAALRKVGVEALIQPANGLSEALVAIESEVELRRPDAAVAVGTGEEALALAITAAKAGVPVAVSAGSDPAHNPDRNRILATLAELDAGPDPARAADLIAAWLRGEAPPSDLN